jgi:hypothetical protein
MGSDGGANMYGLRSGGVVAAIVLLTTTPASPAAWSVGLTPRLEGPSASTAHGEYLFFAGNTKGPGGRLSIPQPRPTFQRAPAGTSDKASKAALDYWAFKQRQQQRESGNRYGGGSAWQREYCARNPKSRRCGYRGEQSGPSVDPCKQNPLGKTCLTQGSR